MTKPITIAELNKIKSRFYLTIEEVKRTVKHDMDEVERAEMLTKFIHDTQRIVTNGCEIILNEFKE